MRTRETNDTPNGRGHHRSSRSEEDEDGPSTSSSNRIQPMQVEEDASRADDDRGEAVVRPSPAAAASSSSSPSQPNMDDKDMSQVLQYWDSKHTQSGFDPIIVLRRLAEIFERENEIYMRKDPDPFDERHPYRTDPSCQFGFLLKQLFRKEQFMTKLVNDYLRDNYFIRQNVQKSSLGLNITALRLILVIMPGLETSAAFQVDFDHLIHRIYGWAEDSIEPLQSYATGLLAAAMEETVIAVAFREQNTRLVPKMIKRLHMLQAVYKNSSSSGTAASTSKNLSYDGNCNMDTPGGGVRGLSKASPNRNVGVTLDNSNVSISLDNSHDGGPLNSNSIYKRMYIPVYPASSESSQMLILRYLTTMGEYQEFLGLFFEHNAIQLIFGYIENLNSRDTCLAFEALKYLASLFCHKKFALEFITRGGLELLLKVPRPSIAATGVSITLYYLAYTEDAMERICTMPKPLIRELVKYALWILGHSYDSGKCHATMFFGLSFQFKVILDEFDAQDGLRKLYNVISVLKILNPSNNDDVENNTINEDEECASRQIVRHVCVALKRYMESHLFYKYNSFMRQQFPLSSEFNNSITKATKANLEQISEQIRILQENISVRNHWGPVDQLLKLGGITLLFKIIAFSYDWNNGGLSETVRSALDVLSICCVMPRVFPTYCDLLELPDNSTTSGIYSILGAAAGDIVPDADVQKAALAVLCNCVCFPVCRNTSINMIKCLGTSSRRNKHNIKYCEDLIEKIWGSVCSNNGIIVLLSLVQIKTPITDADCIRGMACRALAGLVRSERVRQIVGKLPLFASGQIQTLMRDPILQEKRAEHVTFQKYALELLEQVSGKAKPLGHQLDSSLANIHKANVIAQTKIQYNEQQLYQLIHDHLESKGLSQTAQMLQKEAGLPTPSTAIKNFHQSPFDYKVSPSNTIIARTRLRNRQQELNSLLNGCMMGCASSLQENGIITPNSSFISEDNFAFYSSYYPTPIKLMRKTEKTTMPGGPATPSGGGIAQMQRSLQKQIYHIPEMNMGEELESPGPTTTAPSSITLNTIVTEYLTNQHALCNNPMTTCPQFDLFTPHKCPDPKPNRVLGDNLNITARLFKSQAGYNTGRSDRRYVHTNFAPIQTIRSNDFSEAAEFTSCHIMEQNNMLVVGTQQGEAKVFHLNDGSELFGFRCHSFLIDSVQTNRKGNLLITSSSWRAPLSVLWSISNNDFVSKVEFNDEFYCEFSKQSQDKIIGTQSDCAIIYDVETGQKISTFTPTLGNQYTKNRATLCPADELVLSDGVLWDVKSGKEIHKFDKLNQSLSGVFHPNGLEIISNTEVWDIRTFHLLQTIPVLDQCHIKFSPMRVLYGISLDMENRSDFDDNNTYDTSFKVLDAYDYSSISTVDVKRNIYDLSVSSNGSQIALVENQPSYDTKPETFVKVYAVGVKRHEHEEEVRASFSGGMGGGRVSLNVLASSSGEGTLHGQNISVDRGSSRGGGGFEGDVGAGGGGGVVEQAVVAAAAATSRSESFYQENRSTTTEQEANDGFGGLPSSASADTTTTTTSTELAAAIDAMIEELHDQENILFDIGISLNTLFCLQEEDDAPDETDEDHSDSDSSTDMFNMDPNAEIGRLRAAATSRRRRRGVNNLINAAEFIIRNGTDHYDDSDQYSRNGLNNSEDDNDDDDRVVEYEINSDEDDGDDDNNMDHENDNDTSSSSGSGSSSNSDSDESGGDNQEDDDDDEENNGGNDDNDDDDDDDL